MCKAGTPTMIDPGAGRTSLHCTKRPLASSLTPPGKAHEDADGRRQPGCYHIAAEASGEWFTAGCLLRERAPAVAVSSLPHTAPVEPSGSGPLGADGPGDPGRSLDAGALQGLGKHSAQLRPIGLGEMEGVPEHIPRPESGLLAQVHDALLTDKVDVLPIAILEPVNEQLLDLRMNRQDRVRKLDPLGGGAAPAARPRPAFPRARTWP